MLTRGPLPLLRAKYPIQAWHRLTAGPRPDPEAGHPKTIRWFGFRAMGQKRDPLQIPLVNFLFQIFSTKSFDLKVHAAGLGDTHTITKAQSCLRFRFISFLPPLHPWRSWSQIQAPFLPSPHPVGQIPTKREAASDFGTPQLNPLPEGTGPGDAGCGQQLTFPTSSGPGWRVTEQGRLVAIWAEQGKREKSK